MKVISLVIRGKVSEDHNPSWFNQHSDVVLSTGAPVGFFAASSAYGSKMFSNDGDVFDFETYKSLRPQYVDVTVAKQMNSISTICRIEVTDLQAQKFDQYWKMLASDVDSKKERYNLIGNNCSSRANQAFVAAGILDKEIPGLDTPNNLYEQLKNKYPGSFACKSGYVGFKKVGHQFQTEYISN